jgi:putative DNA primase/helicase
MLSNETGRTRMTSATTQARTAQWKLMMLSSGEVSVTDHAGTAGKQVKAGTDIRLLNIPVGVHPESGSFQDLHDFDSPKELAEHLNENVRTCYGSAGRAFLELMLTDREAKMERLREVINRFVRENLDKSHASEVQRVANRFALMAAAGTLATEVGITGWRKDDAYQACVDCYGMWIGARGTAGSTDDERALRQVRKFLELYGSSRFVPNENSSLRVDRCAGVREKDGGVFYISREVFASEVCAGFDPKRVAKMLAESGYLDLDSDGRYLKKPRLKTEAVCETRFYAVKASIFGDDAEDEEEAA